jgi:hypothetical protein
MRPFGICQFCKAERAYENMSNDEKIAREYVFLRPQGNPEVERKIMSAILYTLDFCRKNPRALEV